MRAQPRYGSAEASTAITPRRSTLEAAGVALRQYAARHQKPHTWSGGLTVGLDLAMPRARVTEAAPFSMVVRNEVPQRRS